MNMMTQDQAKIVMAVYRKFAEQDEQNAEEWTPIDEYMEKLDWLNNGQLIIEAQVKYNEHKSGEPRCQYPHGKTECIVPIIVDAVMAILDLYKKTGNLHEKNRFILMYYLALSQANWITS